MAYASAAHLVLRYDERLIAELSVDNDTRPADPTTEPRVLACLEDASADILSAVSEARRYPPETLDALALLEDPYLVRLTCDLTLGLLYRARGKGMPAGHQEAVDWANDEVQALRQGKRVLNVPVARAAGLPAAYRLSTPQRGPLRQASDQPVFPSSDGATIPGV